MYYTLDKNCFNQMTKQNFHIETFKIIIQFKINDKKIIHRFQDMTNLILNRTQNRRE